MISGGDLALRGSAFSNNITTGSGGGKDGQFDPVHHKPFILRYLSIDRKWF